MIIIIEKENESTEMSVARCSEGNISCSSTLVRTCNASSPTAVIKPPKAITQYNGECSASNQVNTKDVDMANIHL